MPTLFKIALSIMPIGANLFVSNSIAKVSCSICRPKTKVSWCWMRIYLDGG
eukprot:gnl/Chilomastix_caulleri/5840.p2 GENE.gnl/Chilomastix_caulleri/5840~~gnl/Chilomastix_caulleri/5840.p2  ORF type:complete len:51 (-),score=7.23 gnl/Chilomastix_caulleri/5840:24-176(-)